MLFTNMPEVELLAWISKYLFGFFFLALVKMPLPIPTYLLGILPFLKLQPLLPDILI